MTSTLTEILDINKILSTISPDLSALLSSIHLLPMSWRKATLKHCRIQRCSTGNRHVRAIYGSIPKYEIPLDNGALATANWLQDINDTLLEESPIIASIVSMWVRCEAYHSRLEPPEEIIEETIAKEVAASQQKDLDQSLNYDFLFKSPRTLKERVSMGQGGLGHVTFADPEDLVRNDRLYRLWSEGLDRYRSRISEQHYIIVPAYSRQKNIGYAAQDNLVHSYYVYGHDSDIAPTDRKYTSLSLEQWYAKTGERVTGPMEMRIAWKHNDLKPRVYYATGGDGYFASSLLRGIAKQLLNILPCTHVNTRYDVTRVTGYRALTENELLVTYDYTSFTTSLAELKYFIFHLATYFSGTLVKVLDFYQGVIKIDLGEYLHEYNDTVNLNPAYDTARIAGTFDWVPYYHQLRNGMLGVQGNIAFSTLLHGIHISRFRGGHATTCCVGDDCLLRVGADDYEPLIDHVNVIGTIQRERFTTWRHIPYPTEADMEDDQVFPFCKRPTGIDYFGGVYTEYLPPFPNLAALFNLTDKYHTNIPSSSDSPRFDACLKFAKQCGVFFRRIRTEIPDTSYAYWEQEAVVAILEASYDYMGMPSDGCFPHCAPLPRSSRSFKRPDRRNRSKAARVRDKPYTRKQLVDSEMVTFPIFVPPISLQCFQEDWETILTRSWLGRKVLVPATTPNSIHPEYCSGVGWSTVCTPFNLQQAAIDFGAMRKEIVMEQVVVDEGTSEVIQKFVQGVERPLYRYTCIAELPDWYNQAIPYYFSRTDALSEHTIQDVALVENMYK